MAETNEFDAYWANEMRQRDLEVGATDGAKGIAGAAISGTGSLISNLSVGDIARGTRGLVDPTMNKVEEGGVIDTALTWLNNTFDPEGNERKRVSERVKELQASGSLPQSDSQNKELTVAALPGLSALVEPLKGAEVVGDIADKAIKPAAKFIGEPIKEVGKGIIESTSPDMQEAMSNPEIFKGGKLGRGAGDPAAWAGVAAQAVGSMIPTVATAAITKNPTAGLGVGIGMSVGQAGDSAYYTAINSNPMDLIESPVFVGELKKVSQDPEFAELDGAAKVEEAQRRYAELSSSMAKSKPETMAAAAMGTLLGDATIVKTMLGSGAGGAVRGMLKGAATEAPGEFGEEWLQQYVGNTTQNQMANTQLVEPMSGTLDAGLHGAAGGVMAGGTMGGAAAKFAKVLHANKDNLTPEQAVQVVERSMKNRGIDDATARQVAEQAASMMANPDLTPVDNTQVGLAQQVAEQSPLGPSASQFDELRDVPAYLRRDDTAERFKGMAENSPVQEALAGTPAPTVDDLLSQAMSQQVDAIEDPAISSQHQAAAENAVKQPTATTDTAGGPVVDEAAQAQSLVRNAAPSALDAAVGPLQTLRITRKGKPFATEKEAAMASRKGKEMPVPLNGGGFGVAEIAEVEQAKAAVTTQESAPLLDGTGIADSSQPSDPSAASVSAETVPAPSEPAGDISQPAQAIDTGYREVIPTNQPQAEVSNEPVTPVPAISREGQGDQSSAGEPAAAGDGPAIAGLTDRAGPGNPADSTAAPPVPNGQQQDDPTLTAPAIDAGAAVSEVVQPEPVAPEPAAAPTPWAEAIDNPDGTITLRGDVPLIKQWAKESGVKAMPGKGGLLVAKSSAAKVREYVAPATSEPAQQIEAARAEVAPEPTDAQKEAGNYKKGHIKLQGLDIALENPKGSTRSGTDKDGKAWQSTMAHDYGYIKRTLGADGDHVDVFIGDQPDSEMVYVVDQVDPKTGKFDEHKVMMGFADEQAAKAGYLANYEKGWKGLGSIKTMPVEEFKRWVKDGDTTKPIAVSNDAAGKITDFGEKIGGARKDAWAAYRDTVEGETAEQIKALPLSKAWPAPDYDKLIESGVDRQAVAIARSARDAIPAKPRASHKINGWAEAVKHMRDMALGLLDGSIDADKARRAMLSSSLRGSHAVMNRAELYQAVGHQRSLADLTLSSGSYSLYGGIKYDPPKSIWTISRESKSSAFGNWPRTIASGSSKAEVISEFKRHYEQLTSQESKPKAVSFDIYSNDNRRSWIVGKKVGRNYLALTEPFEKISDARQYRADNYDELVSKLGKAKEIPRERRDINQPRVGEDMRGGADVSPELFGEAFGFRGVEFGNWVEQGRRQQDLNNAYDALMDMAAVLGISPKSLSLNGELGLAFGARGSGGVNPAAAHYESGKVVINLTKMNGAGSLGHEWWHALDGYFSRMRGQPSDMMTEARDVALSAMGSQYIHRGSVRKEMVDAFGAVNRAIKQTSLKERSRKLDDKRSKDYWTTDPELSARAFESFLIAKLQDQNASNDYLANIVSEASWDKEASMGMRLEGSYPYPTAGEIPTIRAGFDHFFDTIQEREEGGKRVLFSKQAMAQGDKPSKHLTSKEAELVTSMWFKQYPRASEITVKIHATQTELESALGLDAKDGLIRRAAFDDDSGTLHVAADTIATPRRMREILRHEVLAHYGLAHVLGDGEYTKLMSRLIKSKKDPSMKSVWDWVETHYADDDIGVQAEEVVAHLAEMEPSAWQRGWDRVVAWVTRSLRAMGFVPDGITAAETRTLIEGLGNKMQGRGQDERSKSDVRFNQATESEPHLDVFKPASNEVENHRSSLHTELQLPLSSSIGGEQQNVLSDEDAVKRGIKFSQSSKRQVGAALGAVKSWLKQGRPVMLGTLTDLQIDQVYRDITGGAVSQYQRLRTQMESDRNDILLDAETRIDPLWEALGKQVKADLSNLMHDATMSRLHPDKSLDENSYYREAKQKAERAKKPETRAAYEAELHIIERNHSELARQYNALPANAKELYGTMLDTYTNQWESLRGAIEQRLEDLLGVSEGRAMAAEMRQKMEHALQHGPYFPLTRYGDYVVKARKGDEYVREHFERRADAEQAVKQYQSDGYNAVMTVKEEGGGDSANANQLGMEMLSFLDSADGVSKSALKDEIWQAMLRMMPDASYAKHAIHRRRVKGASRDAHRAYLNSVYHYARHVSKIRYGHKMQGELDKLSEQIRAGVGGEPSSLKPGDLEIAQQVLNEMNKRHDLNMNPTGKAWAGSAGNIGFLYYIGPSVASAVVNMTQNFTVMLPQLGAKYGFAKSAAAMTQALGDYVKHGKFKSGTSEAWHSLTRSTTLPADERAMLDRLYRAGALDLTQAHSIAAKADTDQQDAKPMSKHWRRAMRWAGATFHNAEVLNREVAALAAYRLLKQAEPTLDGQQYADRVAEMVYDGHGNYAASNRPRYMRNDITKVLTQFKIYSQMMTYVLYSNAIKAAKAGSLKAWKKGVLGKELTQDDLRAIADGKLAAKTLGGVLATHWVMAGVMGLPTPISAVVYAIAAGLDDDDDRSGEASFRLALTEALGPRAGELLAKGPMDALTNLSIAGRTGLGDLWWRSPKEGTEGDDLAWHAVQQLLGPVAGIGINLTRGAGQMTDGHIQRGLETMLPKSIRDVAKAYRQATEGEQTIKGDIIMDDVSTWNVAMQGLGFGSAKMAKNYDAREYIKGKEKRIADKRSQLLTDYYMARKSGDMDEVQEVMERIKMFNSIHHPGERITSKSLALSFKSKRRSNDRTQGGVYLNRKREYLRDEGRFAD